MIDIELSSTFKREEEKGCKFHVFKFPNIWKEWQAIVKSPNKQINHLKMKTDYGITRKEACPIWMKKVPYISISQQSILIIID